ncbi:hypothetical protein B0T14DRAFT_589456 [Immersiella caudata]|uniref:Uncharacterized protein n=1 Tax=Immersiella caudata TaxID=314043 RepID=A0AA39WKJ5_9PEZI|nr:hypothetical protein B0T14DRAFT_589456 [Immersiella caudata]
MGYPDTFEGFVVDSPKAWNQFHKSELKPKPFEDNDIDVEIKCCGVCGSDVHTVTGGWGDFEERQNIKKGDRVGFGAQVWACLNCDICKEVNENYHPHLVDTYNAKYGDGSVARGGWADYIRAHEYFTFKIPDAQESHVAAPLLCAGITTYSPPVRAGVGPGKRVGIIGIGGLGHLAVQWGAGLGAETYALTHSPGKTEDAKKCGAKDVIVTTEKGFAKKWAYKFDMLLKCSDAMHKMDIPEYMSMLKVGGEFHMVGIPDHPLPEMAAMAFTANAPKLSGSHLGNNQGMNAMLKLAAEKGIKPMVETLDLSEAGCKKAV